MIAFSAQETAKKLPKSAFSRQRLPLQATNGRESDFVCDLVAYNYTEGVKTTDYLSIMPVGLAKRDKDVSKMRRVNPNDRPTFPA